MPGEYGNDVIGGDVIQINDAESFNNAIVDIIDSHNQDTRDSDACYPAQFEVDGKIFPGLEGAGCVVFLADVQDSAIDFTIVLDGGVIIGSEGPKVVDVNNTKLEITTTCRIDTPCDIDSATHPWESVRLNDTYSLRFDGVVKLKITPSGVEEVLNIEANPSNGELVVYKDGQAFLTVPMPTKQQGQLDAVLDLVTGNMQKVFNVEPSSNDSDVLGGENSDIYVSGAPSPHNVGGPSMGSAGERDYSRKTTGCEAGPKGEHASQPFLSSPLMGAIIAICIWKLAKQGGAITGRTIRDIAGRAYDIITGSKER